MKRTSDASSDEQASKRPRELYGMANSFKCSITTALIVEPVALEDGQIHEKSAIERWLKTKDTSPNTGAKLAHKHLTALPAVRTAIKHLIDAGLVAPDERSDWWLRKGIAESTKRDWPEAKSALQKAFELGQQAAGYHLGRAWLDEAAEAGVSEAVQAVARLSPPAAAAEALVPIDDPSTLAAGDVVRVLSEEQIRSACEENDEFGDSDLFIEFAGDECTIKKVDGGDDTIMLLEPDLWFPIQACAFLRAASPIPFASIDDVAMDQYVRLRDEVECRAAFEADSLDFPLVLAGNRHGPIGTELASVTAIDVDRQRVTLGPSYDDDFQPTEVPFGALSTFMRYDMTRFPSWYIGDELEEPIDVCCECSQ